MSIVKYIDKDNLHHAYLVEGAKEEVIPEIISFLEKSGFSISGNTDFSHQVFDTFKIEDARKLREFANLRSVNNGKKFFIIYANLFVLPAQNTLLKIFEEPKEDTHFFVVTPNTTTFIPTLVSRFYLIKTNKNNDNSKKEAIGFLKMNKRDRIEFIKSLIAGSSTKNIDDQNIEDSSRLRSLNFLDALESVLHDDQSSLGGLNKEAYKQIWKAREFVSQPGASVKTLMESVALIAPKL